MYGIKCENCDAGEEATHKVLMKNGLIAICDKCYED